MAVVVSPVYSESEIREIQKRTLRVLIAGQIAGSAALSAAVTVGAFVIQDILGQKTPWGGIASATVTIGTAFMAQLLSRLMLRQGRRRGLMLGYSLALVGGLIAGFGVETTIFDWLSSHSSRVIFCGAATTVSAPGTVTFN